MFAELEWSLGTAKSKEEMEESVAEVCACLWAELQHQAETLYKCRRSWLETKGLLDKQSQRLEERHTLLMATLLLRRDGGRGAGLSPFCSKYQTVGLEPQK